MAFLAHRNRKRMMRRGYPEYFVPLVFTFLACSYIMFPMWVQLAVTVLCMAAGRLYPGCICIALSKTSARCDQIVPTVRHTTTHSDTPTHRAVCQVCVKLWHILSVSVCYVVTSDTYNVARVCQYSTTLCTVCYCPLRPNYNCQAASQVWILLQHLAWPRLTGE